MSVADKDGRMAQVVGDLHACLGISINESVREAKAEFDHVLADLDPMKGKPMNTLITRLRRLFCSHSSTEMETKSETSPAGVYTTRTTRHICTRCGKDMM